jgi:hypothetical protein
MDERYFHCMMQHFEKCFEAENCPMVMPNVVDESVSPYCQVCDENDMDEVPWHAHDINRGRIHALRLLDKMLSRVDQNGQLKCAAN